MSIIRDFGDTPFLINTAPDNGRVSFIANVGIGTSTPLSNLHVVGNILISNNGAFTGGIVFSDGTFQATAGGGGTTAAIPLGQVLAISTNLAMP